MNATLTPMKRTKQIRVDDDIAEMANQIGALEKKSAPDLLSEILRPLLKKRLAQALERSRRELEQD